MNYSVSDKIPGLKANIFWFHKNLKHMTLICAFFSSQTADYDFLPCFSSSLRNNKPEFSHPCLIQKSSTSSFTTFILFFDFLSSYSYFHLIPFVLFYSCVSLFLTYITHYARHIKEWIPQPNTITDSNIVWKIFETINLS